MSMPRQRDAPVPSKDGIPMSHQESWREAQRRHAAYDPLAKEKARRQRYMNVPFLDDAPMDDTPPSFKLANFKVPKLRRCTFDVDTINWRRAALLGAGMDGCVWRVYFGDKGPYALKLFWDADATNIYWYWAAQRECQNAALLQMLRASLDQAAEAAATVAAGGTPAGPAAPIYVYPNPVTFEDATSNFINFSEEERRYIDTHGADTEHGAIRMVPMPRFARCYGWLRVNGDALVKRMPRHVRPYTQYIDKETRYLQDGETEHYAIVYEYIHSAKREKKEEDIKAEATVGIETRSRRTRREAMEAERARVAKMEKDANDPEQVTAVARFLYLAGFSFCPRSLARNWKDGVLIDHADIISPRGFGWNKRDYRPRSVTALLCS